MQSPDSFPEAAEAPVPRTAGASLATERERQGLSRSDIAQRLHMSVSQVEALETGDYARLPKGTFLRGFVRNYAKVVGLDPGVVVAMLAESAPRDPRPGIVVSSQNIRFDPLNAGLSNPYVKAGALATVVVVLAFAALYWWFFIRPTPPASVARRTVVESIRSQPVAAPVPQVPVAPAVIAVPAVREEPPPAVAPVAAAAPTDPAAVVAAGGSVLRFKFKGAAWVEIRDGRGRVLLSKTNPGGSEAEVAGKGPFAVVVGNAPEVQMFFNNREFNLEPHTRVAVARFTVD